MQDLRAIFCCQHLYFWVVVSYAVYYCSCFLYGIKRIGAAHTFIERRIWHAVDEVFHVIRGVFRAPCQYCAASSGYVVTTDAK